MLTDPSRDARAQLDELTALAAGVPGWRAALPELAAWWSGLEALLAQVIAEVTLGLEDGEDAARRDFLLLSESVLHGAVMALARVQRGGDLNTRLRVAPVFDAHVCAWHAIRGARQNVSWLGARGWISGRLPILALTTDGTAALAPLVVDPLTAVTLTWWDATQALNALAAGLQWRA